MNKKGEQISTVAKIIKKEQWTICAGIEGLLFLFGILYSVLNGFVVTSGIETNASYFLEKAIVAEALQNNTNDTSDIHYSTPSGEDYCLFYSLGEMEGQSVIYQTDDSCRLQSELIGKVTKLEQTQFTHFDYHFVMCISGQDMVEKIYQINPKAQILFDISDYRFYGSIDETKQMFAAKNNFWLAVLYTTIASLCLFPLFYLLSKIIVKPVRESLKNQKAFIADASHNLKTPLAVIRADTELLACMNQLQGQKYLSDIQYQIENMNQMILDMLELDRLDHMDTKKEDVNLSELLEKLSLGYEVQAFEKGIRYTSSIDPNLVLSGADPKLIKTIMTLMMDNAMKYAKGDKVASVRLYKNSDGIVFNVYNTGCVVRDSDRSKIFQRFFRGEETNGPTKGSGLGLSIINTICEKYQYSIELDMKYMKYFSMSIHFGKS